MSVLFVGAIKYFVNLKLESLKSKLIRITAFNIFIIICIYYLYGMRTAELLTTGIITIIRLVDDVYKNYPLEMIWTIFRWLITPVQLLFELLMICYMIFYWHKMGKKLNVN